MDEIQEHEHVCNWWPREEVVGNPPRQWWRFWDFRVVLIKLHWYCTVCGVELEPVFHVKP